MGRKKYSKELNARIALDEINVEEELAELASEDEGVAQAVEEFVERAVENAGDSSQEYTFADSITEVQLEAFIENPIQELTDIDFSDVGNVAEIGCGYGGQTLVNDQLLNVESARLFDLPFVNKLIDLITNNIDTSIIACV